MAFCLCFFLFYAQDLAWGLNIRGTRRDMAPDWRWLHVGESAIFWLVGVLSLSFFGDNWPTKFSRPVNVFLRTMISMAIGATVYFFYYRYAHLLLGTQKGLSHPQQFPMIWLINIFLVNMWFMDGWPGWRALPKTTAELDEVEETIVAHDVAWTPSLANGLAVGTVSGIAVYFGVINILPWIGHIQMIR